MPKVPTSAPAVAHADRLPTMRPVCSRSRSCSLATTGLTALSTKRRREQDHQRDAAAPAARPCRARRSPNVRASGTAAMQSSPPAASSSGSSQRPSKRSAARPPAAAPAAMPASAAPMIAVVVSSVRPDVGRQQPHAEDLEHEHRAGRQEDERAGRAGAERPARRGREGGHGVDANRPSIGRNPEPSRRVDPAVRGERATRRAARPSASPRGHGSDLYAPERGSPSASVGPGP